MIAEYTDRTGNPTEYRVAIEDPEDAAGREAVLTELRRRGARFPGNAAGFTVLGHRWEPTPNTKSGGRKVAGCIWIETEGAPLANGVTEPRHEAAVYVYDDQPRLILTLPDELRAGLQDLSSRTGAPIAELTRRAVREYLERQG
jgi:hypothetical protein